MTISVMHTEKGSLVGTGNFGLIIAIVFVVEIVVSINQKSISTSSNYGMKSLRWAKLKMGYNVVSNLVLKSMKTELFNIQ